MRGREEIFCCCSPKEGIYLQEQMGHLKGLTNQGFMLWSRDNIGVETRRREEIDAARTRECSDSARWFRREIPDTALRTQIVQKSGWCLNLGMW